MRVGLVGCGQAATREHLPGFARLGDAARVTAVASGRVDNARAAAERFGVGTVHETWQELVADARVDAVDVCTTNALHEAIAVAAATNGKHVLVEKPMATTVAGCDAMIGSARSSGVTLMVHHNMRFVPAFVKIRETVPRVGRLFAVRAVFAHSGPDVSWSPTADWFFRSEIAGGGALLDLGVHIIDLVRWFAGREPVEVTAMTSTVDKPTDAEDNAMLVIRFEGDLLATVHTAWTAYPSRELELSIQGELGRLTYRRGITLQLTTGERLVVEPEAGRESLYANFVECVRTGEAPRASGADGRAAVAVACAAYESARSGRAVPVTASR